MLHLSGSPSRVRASTMILLAPSVTTVPDTFTGVNVDPHQHDALLSQLQRLRGAAYLCDGAISEAQLTDDGRHAQDVDAASWHVVSVGSDGQVVACARYCAHEDDVAPEGLGVWRSALARSATWQTTLREAVVEEMALARRRGIAFVEVGGWAVADEFRRTAQALDTALSTFALAESIGGCIGLTTATVRHCSARILRKLGGRSLQQAGRTVPSYFDPQYGCDMEILRFDSSAPSRRYLVQIERMAQSFRHLPVICSTPGHTAPSVADRAGLLPTLASLAERHVPCYAHGELTAA